MTIGNLKELLEKERYQDVLNQLARLVERGKLSSLSLVEQAKYAYYESRALFGLGRYEEALKTAARVQEKISSSEEMIPGLSLLVAKLYALTGLGRLDEGLEASTEGDVIIESLTNAEQDRESEIVAFFYNVKGIIYRRKGDLDTALHYYMRSLALRESIGNPQHIAASLSNIGNIYLYKGDLDTALDYHQRSLTLKETIGNLQGIAMSLNNIGTIYHAKGLLDTALESWQRGLTLYETIGNPQNIAMLLNNIGEIFRAKGELDTALDYYQRALMIDETIGNPQYTSIVLFNIGVIYKVKGELDTALDYLQRGLTLCESVGNDFETSETLFQTVLVLLDKQDQVKARKCLSRLQELHDRTPEKKVQLFYRLAEALILKQSKRLKDKMRAQILLVEIVGEKPVHFEQAALAMIHLCELLLFELMLLGEPEVLVEAKNLVQELYVLAQDQNSFSLAVKIMILRAKFAIVEIDLQQAQQYLDKARKIAEEKNLGLLVQEALDEQVQLESDYNRWQEIIQQKMSIQGRLELSRIIEYLKEAKKLVKSFRK
ncbi:MAG: tetratricopeptide repeat protein [Candidatus Hodarchaeales archaeon]|jgi:tetratricopeptide (TPR) repeat protein